MEGGLFITLYDRETLRLYLDQGVYGQHMPPQENEPSPYSAHYRTLADYGCGREGKHVFFFLEREIYYGGQLTGSSEFGAFYLNGQKSPMGREADAPLVWDESSRVQYEATNERGVFRRGEDDRETCQPFLLQFEDTKGIAGNYIISDQLYFELGEYPYPLPANSISGMGLCTLTPGETAALLRLLEREPEGFIQPRTNSAVALEGEPLPYSPEFGIQSLADAVTESHLEASVLANPRLLPADLQPHRSVLCRQVPISPFKPSQMDKADICIFNEPAIADGTLPNTIIELKNDTAGKGAAKQVCRYLRWLNDRLGSRAQKIDLFVYAPSFTSTFDTYIPGKFAGKITKIRFTDGSQRTL